MKNIKLFAGICMFVSALAFLSACSDDDNGTVAPVFPDKVEELSLTTAGETAEFSFTANTDWTLTSSKLWCKFVSEGENMVMLYGPAGEQNVKVIVTDDIWDFEAATAEISLNMGDESKVIAKITRGAKGLVINGYDDEHPLNISYGYSQDGIKATITMDANFDWELTENGVPEWLTVEDLPLKGFAGRSSEITFVVKNDAKVSAQTGVISFNQIGTDELRSFPVNYAGMGDRDIEISLGGNVWNWIVSQDGKQYWQGSITEGVEVEKNDLPMDVEIATKDNKYHIVKLVHGDESLEEPFRNEYFWVDDYGKGNISIPEFSPNSADEREGFILAIPNFVYENELDNDINNLLDEYDKYSIKYEYGQYVVWNFKQEGSNIVSSGFEVKSQAGDSYECQSGDFTGSGFDQWLNQEYGVELSSVYSVLVPKNTQLVVDPKMTMEEWMPGFDENFNITSGLMAFNTEGNIIEDLNGWILGNNSNETGFVINFELKDTTIVVFKDINLVNKKALILVTE